MRNHHHLKINRNQFVSMGEISIDDLQSLENRKKYSNLFLTQKTIGYQQQICQHHYDLNYYLDNLGSKVQGIVQHNEAQILAAYKRHFAKVKKELEEFKQQTEAHANSSSSYKEKIQLLEKELAIFRQESLKLFSRVSEKDKIIEQLKFNIDELMSEKKHMDGVLKQLAKKNKELQCQKSKYLSKKPEGQSLNLQINSFSKNFEVKNKLRQKRYFEQKRPFSNLSKRQQNSSQSKTITYEHEQFSQFPQDNIIKHLRLKLAYLDESTMKDVHEAIQQILGNAQKRKMNYLGSSQIPKEKEGEQSNRFTYRSKSNYTVDVASFARNSTNNPNSKRKNEDLIQKSQNFSNNLELCQYFKKCIDTVRKEIGVRRKLNTINFFKPGTTISISQFKKIDFFRLMELVCSHESVLQALYNSLIETCK